MTQNLLDTTDEDQISLDEGKNYLEELVGPGKKFATNEDLAKGKAYSDIHATILEKRIDAAREEMRKLRDENIAGPKLQELLDKNELLLQQLTSRQNTPGSNEDLSKAAYDPKEVESLVSKQFREEKQIEREQANYDLIKDKLTQRFGNNYKNDVKAQSDALGLTDEEVNSMARKNPNLFIKTFDLNVARDNNSFQTPPKSDKRSDNFAPRGAEKRTWSYYEGLRKKDPMAWMDKKIAVQMEKDAQALGKEFYDA